MAELEQINQGNVNPVLTEIKLGGIGDGNKVLTSDEVSTNLDTKLNADYGLNVVSFGAVGDQSTNSTAAIQAAIDQAATYVGADVVANYVYIPTGWYVVDSLTLKKGVYLVGASDTTTILQQNGTAEYFIRSAAGGANYSGLFNLQLRGIGVGGLSTGVRMDEAQYQCYIQNVTIKDFYISIHVFDSWTLTIQDCNLRNSIKHHLLIDGMTNGLIDNNRIDICGEHNIYIDRTNNYTSGLVISNNAIQKAQFSAFHIVNDSIKMLNIRGNFIEGVNDVGGYPLLYVDSTLGVISSSYNVVTAGSGITSSNTPVFYVVNAVAINSSLDNIRGAQFNVFTKSDAGLLGENNRFGATFNDALSVDELNHECVSNVIEPNGTINSGDIVGDAITSNNNININTSTDPTLNISPDGSVVNKTSITQYTAGVTRIDRDAETGIATMHISPKPADGLSTANITMFRDTVTTGNRFFQIKRGDGSNDTVISLSPNDPSYINTGEGLVIGGTTTNETFEVIGTMKTPLIEDDNTNIYLNGIKMSSATPLDGQVLTYNGTTQQMEWQTP